MDSYIFQTAYGGTVPPRKPGVALFEEPVLPGRFISYHTAMEELIEEAERTRPYAPENGKPLRFKVGDAVQYYSDGGTLVLPMVYRISALMTKAENPGWYAMGYRYWLDSAKPTWMPVAELNLRPYRGPRGAARLRKLGCP